ncbi:hypothetical protein KBC77_02365 [Candidatus Saccharibacteria bacterium]|nr:hypothetical protein [Candidatus Saccharibacteria bacterium]
MSKLPKIEKQIVKDAVREQRVLNRKFPLSMALLASFGLVCLFYGFEHIIEKTPFLVERPLLMVVLGLGCLFVTGQIYKKLD